MIRTRDDAYREMLRHISYAIEEDATAEWALAHATLAQTLCNMLHELPNGAPSSIADAVR